MKAFPTTKNVLDGMDLRDYFAAKAMQAIMTNDTLLMEIDQYQDCGSEYKIARYAYNHADAMMKIRSQNEED